MMVHVGRQLLLPLHMYKITQGPIILLKCRLFYDWIDRFIHHLRIMILMQIHKHMKYLVQMNLLQEVCVGGHC